jgi:succinate dehydrogenase / fumarate reductase cytochrome b subunit
MRYAFWPGCVSKAGTPELYPAATAVAEKIGMELVELDQANCTGAGVLGERNEELVDTLNARNFAIAEQMGLDTILTICSTCQGVMSAVNYKLREKPEYLAKINQNLAAEGLEYKGTVRVTHMMWAIVEELSLEELGKMVVRPLTGLRIAPFYGCYILRPRYVLGMSEHPDRNQYLEKIIETLGAEPIDYEGKLKCCGFPIMTLREWPQDGFKPHS